MTKRIVRNVLLAGGLLAGFGTPLSAGTIILSDFDDGTTQGWVRPSLPGGTLFHSATGGNPGGFIGMIDKVPGAGSATAVFAPPAFTGDLSVHDRFVWDEFVYPHGPHTRVSTGVMLIGGPNETAWLFNEPLGPVAEWVSRSASLHDPTNWSRIDFESATGTDPFEVVVRDTHFLRIGMDTSLLANNTLEAGIDNVGFATNVAPEPSSLCLLSVAAGMLLMRRGDPSRSRGAEASLRRHG